MITTPTPGDKYLSAVGLIWTVERLTADGQRIYLTRARSDGTCGIVIDWTALRRMVPLGPLDDECPPAASRSGRPRSCAEDRRGGAASGELT